MIENLVALESLNNFSKMDGISKFLLQEYPDLKNELIKDFSRKKIENYQEIENLKSDINNLEEKLYQIENLIRINETQELIANMEFRVLDAIKEVINLLVKLMENLGIDIKEVDFEFLEELKSKIFKLNENIEVLTKEKEKLSNHIENDINGLKHLDIEQKSIDKRIEFVKNSEIINSIDKLAEEYNLTDEDKKALLEAEKEIYKKLSKFSINDFGNQQLIVSLNKSLLDIKNQLKEEFEDIDFNYKAILENGIIGGTIGASVGGPLGSAGGFIGGTSGEIAKELVTNLGVNETLADSLQFGIDFLGGKAFVNIGEIILKNLPETFLKDLPTKFEYMAKGILNDMKEYKFVDKEGNIIFEGKIKDIIGTETIKMPYVGSNFEKSNAAGYLRDANYFGQEFLKKYPEMLSEENRARILAGKSPIVDEVWIRYHPNQKSFLGEKLEHHHINNLGEATYIPQTLHRGKFNKDILHVDNDEFLVSLKELIEQKLSKGQA
jgi:hypothetical protein